MAISGNNNVTRSFEGHFYIHRGLGAVNNTSSEMSGGNLKTGLLAATIFPIVLVFVLFTLKKSVRKETK